MQYIDFLIAQLTALYFNFMGKNVFYVKYK